MKLKLSFYRISFRSFSLVFFVFSTILFLFHYFFIALFCFLLGGLFYIYKHNYFILKRPLHVFQQVQQTLNMIRITYTSQGKCISVKNVKIAVYNCIFFSLLVFQFKKEYSTQGIYLAEMISKYQQYI
jgi:uncharacterized protein with PQ loop repeat